MLLKYFNILFTIHNKKNGHSACNPSKINGFRAFIKLDKFLIFYIHNKKNVHSSRKPS